jgi:hypothetical protein
VAHVRYAEFRVLSHQIARCGDRPLRVTGSRHRFSYAPKPGMLYVRSRAISSRTNDNHDTFPAEEIKLAWRTFLGKPVFVNHHNEDPSRSRGVIVDAALHEDVNPDGTPDTWVEVLMEVDAVRFPQLAKLVISKQIGRTSMGCNVAYSTCSYCGNKAETPMDYCRHVARMKGQRIARTTASGSREMVLVSEVCHGLGFFENSLLVEQPADPTAFAWVDEDPAPAPALAATASRARPRRMRATASREEFRLHCCGRHSRHHEGVAGDPDWERRWSEAEPGVEAPQYLLDGARDYMAQRGMAPDTTDYAGVMQDRGRVEQIARHYDAMPDHDPAAVPAYQRLREEVNEQYDHLTNRMGVRVQVVDHDPYPDHRALVEDLNRNKRLQVLSTRSTGGHPVFSDEENDRFRAVHDAFGHAATGRPFDRHGEEAAWRKHAAMFSPEARAAMTTETRGQNSSLIMNGNFAKQKVGLLPEEFHSLGGATRAGRMTPTRASLRAQAAGPRYADPGTHPWYQKTPVHHDNIVEHWKRATDEDKEQGSRWYADAHLVAKALAHGDAAKGAGVLAAYSPQALWPVNMFNAARALESGRAPGGKGSGVYATASMAAQAQAVMDGAHHSTVLKGPKIQDFAHLIEHGGDADPAQPHTVVDRHALSVAAGRRLHDEETAGAPLDNRHYYGHVVSQYAEAARRISEMEGRPVAPHQVQATTWLVRQRENAQEDAGTGKPLDKGRERARQKAQDEWDQHAREVYPELVGPGYHRGSRVTARRRGGLAKTASLRSTAYGERVSPPEVDTLRPEACPVCGNAEDFTSDRCPQCGFVIPPEQLQEPDLDEAERADQEQDGLPVEGPEDDQGPARPLLNFAGTAGGHPDRRTGVDGMSGTPNRAQRERQQLTSALRAQQQTIQAQDARIQAQGALLGLLVDAAGVRNHPRVAALVRKADGLGLEPPVPAVQVPADVPAPAEYVEGYQVGTQEAAGGGDLMATSSISWWSGASPSAQRGWEDGFRAQAAKTAADEEKDPVATTTEQARAPQATDSPESMGAAPAAANVDVTPAAATDSQSTDVALPAEPFNNLVDLTAVPAGVDSPPSVAQSHVPHDISATDPATDAAFTETGWKAASRDPGARIWNAQRLAGLRRAAGTDEDPTVPEYAAAQRIAESDTSDEAIATEAATLDRVLATRQSEPARRPARQAGLVPQPAGGRRSGSPLASVQRTAGVATSTGSVTSDEFIDL